MAGNSAEWIRIPDGNGGLKKIWLRDSTARRDIATLNTDVAGKQDALSTAQLNAVNSGITAAKVNTYDAISVPTAYTSNPAMDGTASAGSATTWARGDHIHPTDTSRQAALSTAQLNAVNSGITATKVATYDAISVPSASSTTPAMDGTGAVGSSNDYARADHVHPSDTAKQDALSTAQLAAVNSGITSKDLAVNDASVLCTVTPIVPTLTTGSHNTTFGGCHYYKIGYRVHVHIGVTGLTSGTTADLWYMPAGYRPYAYVGQTGTGASMTTYSRLRIAPDGRVFINANATGACVDVEYDAFS